MVAPTTATNYEVPSYMIKPPTLGKWEAVRLGIWNPNTKQFLGRTAKSWGGVFIFYIIFYAALAVLFAICLQGLYLTLDEVTPTWQLDSSIIGDNPGMGFRPMAKDVETAGSLVWYVANDSNSVKEWKDSLDEFLKPYAEEGGDNRMHCDYTQRPDDGRVCYVSVRNWTDCNGGNYGYTEGKPCFFIKLNRIFGWKPDPYRYSTEFPDNMPDDLKRHIVNQTEETRDNVWVSCKGENTADQENIGEIEYFPKIQGFAAYHYPFTNKKNYLSPLMAIKLTNPHRNVLINIECRAWAKNIRYSKIRNEREGSVHLEVLID